MKRLLLVRHGESEWNALWRLQGQADIALSETGRQQARALAPTIAALDPDLVLTSDLGRAVETAALIGRPDARREPALREIDVGDWTGQPIAELTSNSGDDYRGWRAGTFTPPAGEAWPDFTARTSNAVRVALGGADRLLVVCHGGVIRALVEKLIGLTPRRIVPVGPGSLTILAARDAGAEMRLEVFNFSPAGPALDAPD